MESDTNSDSEVEERTETTKDHSRHHSDISDLIKVSDVKRAFGEVSVDPLRGASDEQLMHVMGASQEWYQYVKDICNVTNLLPPGGLEHHLKLKSSELPKDSQLQCVKDPKRASNYIQANAYPTQGMMIVPHKPCMECPDPIGPHEKRRDQEYLVLGSQTLTELRDKIQCSKDYFPGEDCSEDPDACNLQILEKGPTRPSKSAFFFISNTFYNDMRHPDSTDYSKRFISTVESSELINTSPRLDHFRPADMASTKFEDIELRLGYPYLYCHHGNCEHLVIFSDIRMLNVLDSRTRADYPLLTSIWHGKTRKCNVCNLLAPAWVTYDDDLAPQCPCFYCNDCFRKLHYTTEGRKACKFKAFPYHTDLCK
ncbi:hypothetical protein EMCRGX_G022263 [Ephydatia muelleri]